MNVQASLTLLKRDPAFSVRSPFLIRAPSFEKQTAPARRRVPRPLNQLTNSLTHQLTKLYRLNGSSSYSSSLHDASAGSAII